jgi:hypothetical protein
MCDENHEQEDGLDSPYHRRVERRQATANKIHSIIGDAVNPQQVGDLVRGRPMRQLLLDELMNDLRARGKVVSAEHL